jgi:rare lipoprotein A
VKKFAFTVAVCVVAASPALAECGQASFYGMESGLRTASGEKFRPNREFTAAMPRRQFGRTVRVTNQRNGRSVLVRVNDLGPAAWTHRIIDLSVAAARALGFVRAGHTSVCVD